MQEVRKPSRRDMLLQTACGLSGLALSQSIQAFSPKPQTEATPYQLNARHLKPLQLKGRLKQSAARWCYNKVQIEDLCRAAKAFGLVGIDLVDRKDWDVLKKHNLQATMVYGAGKIPDGWNRKENHDVLIKEFKENLPLATQYGWKNLITFSGNRKGTPDNEGLENCVLGLNKIKALAQNAQVTVCFELLNSKVDHKDYHFDHMPWGVEIMKRVNSPNIKILYDIYHAQIMDGDIIRTIKEYFPFIGHFHTGGVPGRHELDETQELNWRTVMKSIVDLGYQGYVAHEFVPTKPDPLDSLREAVLLSDV